MADWNERFIKLSQYIADNWSKDKSTKTCAIITNKDNRIVSTGYNGFPSGFNDDILERHERPVKYLYTEHAERNAIYNAARMGANTNKCTMYITWFPCPDCARAIIQSGIDRVVCFKPDFNDERWGDKFVIALEMLEETKIELIYIDDK